MPGPSPGYSIMPALETGQYRNTAFPKMFRRGTHPQFRLSLLEFLRSPRTKNSSAGTLGRVIVVVQVLRPQIRFLQAPAIDEYDASFDLHGFAGNPDDPLDERLGRILRVPEDHDIAAFDIRETIGKLADENPFLISQAGGHAGPLHLDRLDHEYDDEDGGDCGDEDVSSPTAQLIENAGQRPLVLAVRRLCPFVSDRGLRRLLFRHLLLDRSLQRGS